MSFDWSKYLTIAELSEAAANAEPDLLLKEAHSRCAISRAYYSAFNVAFAFMVASWGSGPTVQESKHTWTLDRYDNKVATDPTKQRLYKAVGVKLRRLKTMRANSDYEAVFTGRLETQVSVAIRETRNILNAVGQLN